MPTRLYHKGKMRGGSRISFHKLDPELRIPPPERHTKIPQKRLHSPCFCSHIHTGELIDTFFDVPALLHQVDDVGGVLMLGKLGRILILDRQELTSMSWSSSRQLRFVDDS